MNGVTGFMDTVGDGLFGVQADAKSICVEQIITKNTYQGGISSSANVNDAIKEFDTCQQHPPQAPDPTDCAARLTLENSCNQLSATCGDFVDDANACTVAESECFRAAKKNYGKCESLFFQSPGIFPVEEKDYTFEKGTTVAIFSQGKAVVFDESESIGFSFSQGVFTIIHGRAYLQGVDAEVDGAGIKHKGTSYIVEKLLDSKAKVTVLDGSVSMKDQSGEETALQPSEEASVEDGSVKSTRVINQGELDDFWSEKTTGRVAASSNSAGIILGIFLLIAVLGGLAYVLRMLDKPKQ